MFSFVIIDKMIMKNIYKELFKDSIIEININHNEALDVFSKIKTQNDVLLVNFDSHSDFYLNYPIDRKNAKIADWVNYCIRQFKVKEYYWVIPSFLPCDSYNGKIIDRIFNSSPIVDIENIKEKNSIYSQYLYYDISRFEFLTQNKIDYINNKCKNFDLQDIIESKNLIKTEVKKCYASNLPNFKNNNIWLSVDADYFCNTGFDTNFDRNNNWISEKELIESFNNFLEIIYIKDIKPTAVSLTLSPVYTPKQYENIIIEFYKEIYNCA